MKFIPGKLVNQTFLFVLLLGTWVALAGASMAQNQYYVNASSGNDSNDGSQARPWRTIQHADAALTVGSSGTCNAGTGWLSVTNAGACVHVATGTYAGPITTNKSGTASARIVFISDTKWGAKITTINWAINGSYTDVVGFDGTSASGPNGYGFGMGGGTSNIHILNNYLHDFDVNTCMQAGVINGAPESNPSHDNLIQGNVIRHAGNYFQSASGSVNFCVNLHGIYDGDYNDTIENNIISGITGWGIKIGQSAGVAQNDAISNNVVFNNGGGIIFQQCSNASCGVMDHMTLDNNIVVNNGGDAPQGGRFGINYYHVSGTHFVVTNNMVYGNLPSNYAHHDVACTEGTPISGSDADGTAGGCPSSNPKSDSGTSATFTNFQSDTNTAPASNYNPDNYRIKAGSSAIQNGTTNCASSPGLNPCVPTVDIVGVVRPASTLDIGAYEQGSVASAPSAPTRLTATVQ